MRAVLVVLLFCAAMARGAVPQQINYQGFLAGLDGSPLDTVVSMTFKMYNAATSGTQLWTETQPSCTVRAGLFNVQLGSVTAVPDSFNRAQVWLGVTVGTNSEMVPRTQLVSVPYAYRVGTVDGASGGTISGALNSGADNLNPGTMAFVAGQNNRASGQYSVVVGGGSSATADSNSARGNWSVIGGGAANYADSLYSVISGGHANRAAAYYAAIGGGDQNRATGNYSTADGGYNNTASGGFSSVGGGSQNTATAYGGTVGGGSSNGSSGNNATVGGGSSNSANGFWATVPGGNQNAAIGNYSLAAGRMARANYSGSLVWGDATADTIADSSANEIRMRASGGTWIYSDSLLTDGVILRPGANCWAPIDTTDPCAAGGGQMYADTNTYDATRVWTKSMGYLRGANNVVSATGFVGGGDHNYAGGDYSVIGGGGGTSPIEVNIAMGNWSVIAGGSGHNAERDFSTISGGHANTASGPQATVGGGSFNIASGYNATVGGGRYNFARGNYSVIGGGGTSSADGDSNSATGNWSVIGGGRGNTASGYYYATVSGGNGNTASGPEATVGGGSDNTAGDYATVGGGVSNSSGQYATVGGGHSNIAGGIRATVGGGFGNSASNTGATVGGGMLNTAQGQWSTVSGGGGLDPYARNSALGNYSTVPGGKANVASGHYSFAAGRSAKANHDGTFVWADSTDSDFTSTVPNQFLIRAGGGMGINLTNPAEALEVNGDVKADTFRVDAGIRFPDGTFQTTATSAPSTSQQYSDTNTFDATRTWVQSNGYLRGANNVISATGFVGGGSNNKARGNYSTIAGGGGAVNEDSNSVLGDYSVIGGGSRNLIQPTTHTTIGGGTGNKIYSGSDYAAIGGGFNNQVSNSASVIAGGYLNTVDGQNAAVCGGYSNTVSGSNAAICGGYTNGAAGQYAFVGSGRSNRADSAYSAIGGGQSNRASGRHAAIGGGYSNNASGYSVVGGGYDNSAQGGYSTVPGGYQNHALGENSFAAGQNALADYDGSFVWADATGAVFADSNSNQFRVRATGGIWMFTSASNGAKLPAAATAWVAISDSTKKTDIRRVDTKVVLEKVAQLPISEWRYKAQPDPTIRHIGPMAQDFWNAFHLGEDSLGISTIDPDGVALAAIQELQKEIIALRAEVKALREERSAAQGEFTQKR